MKNINNQSIKYISDYKLKQMWISYKDLHKKKPHGNLKARVRVKILRVQDELFRRLGIPLF